MLLIVRDKKRLIDMGEAAHEHYLNYHTVEKRYEEFMGYLGEVHKKD